MWSWQVQKGNMIGGSPWHSRGLFPDTEPHLSLGKRPQKYLLSFLWFFIKCFYRYLGTWEWGEEHFFVLESKATDTRAQCENTTWLFYFVVLWASGLKQAIKLKKGLSGSEQSLHIKHTLSCCSLVFVSFLQDLYRYAEHKKHSHDSHCS